MVKGAVLGAVVHEEADRAAFKRLSFHPNSLVISIVLIDPFANFLSYFFRIAPQSIGQMASFLYFGKIYFLFDGLLDMCLFVFL